MTENVKLGPQEERLRTLLRRADALSFAYGAVLDEEWTYTETKAEILAVQEEMRVEAHERFESCRQELGISGPTA